MSYRFRVSKPGEMPYEVTGEGLNWGHAKNNVARREGVSESDISLTSHGNAPIKNAFSGSSGGDITMGSIMLLGAILMIGLVMTYWKWILIGGIIVGILCWFGRD